MKTIYVTAYPWEVTPLWLAASDDGLARIGFGRTQTMAAFQTAFAEPVVAGPNGILTAVIDQLENYFAGNEEKFNIQVEFLEGTTFQRSVWERVHAIPYGQVKTYGQIAHDLGKPGAVRAVGAANGANPIPIVVPCHRVLQSDGKLGGYSGGLDIKDTLLRLEGVVL